jgi:hypothetical protein
MHDEVVERFPDLLQNIESAIFSVYRSQPDLLDLDVIDALDALVRTYAAEQDSRFPPKLRLAERAALVMDVARKMCEWRLGRATLQEGGADTRIPAEGANGVADILLCLKRIRKSVHTWNEQAGRQGYLDYIAAFFEQFQRTAR